MHNVTLYVNNLWIINPKSRSYTSHISIPAPIVKGKNRKNHVNRRGDPAWSPSEASSTHLVFWLSCQKGGKIICINSL